MTRVSPRERPQDPNHAPRGIESFFPPGRRPQVGQKGDSNPGIVPLPSCFSQGKRQTCRDTELERGCGANIAWTLVHRRGRGGPARGRGSPGPQALSEVWAAEWAPAEGVGQSGGCGNQGRGPALLHPVLCICWHPLQASGAGLSRPGGLGLEKPGWLPGSPVSQGET